jgi:hypothetical protein
MGRGDLATSNGRCDRCGVRRGLAAALVCALACVASPAADARAARLTPYAGTGSWVSIYDTAAWRDPARVVATLAARHIHTLYLQTSNDRQPTAIKFPAQVAQFIDAAHRADIRVVGWYLPSFAANRRDVARVVAGASFTTPSGGRFDSFALDVESTKVRSIPLRTRRAIAFVAAVRRALPRPYALGAITIDPVGARYWPGYPFRALARLVDVFLPMTYFTARTSGARGVAAYSSANVRRVRALAGDASFPIHPIGGDAGSASVPELRAFLRSAAASGTLGASLWEYGETSGAQWAILERRS